MADLLSKQKNTHGGWRGGGRPKGSKTKLNVMDFFGAGDITAIMKKAIAIAKTKNGSKERIFLLEQAFGKARQNIGLDGGEEGKRIMIEISEAIANKNGLTPSTNKDSE